jgi:hypothetical protein
MSQDDQAKKPHVKPFTTVVSKFDYRDKTADYAPALSEGGSGETDGDGEGPGQGSGTEPLPTSTKE